MTKNPFYNACLAALYIVLVVLAANASTHWLEPKLGDTLLAPISVLSLFVFSAAVMGFIILYQPIVLLLDGQRREAVGLFWRTLAAFAGIAVLILTVAIFR